VFRVDLIEKLIKKLVRRYAYVKASLLRETGHSIDAYRLSHRQ